jgi:anti-sigma-K factor RskA
VDIKAYIESGVIESYVLGMADTQEAAELEQLANQYPEVKQAIDEFEASLEKQAFANAMAPPDDVKDKLMFALKDEFAKEQEGKKAIPPVIPIQQRNNGSSAPIRTISSRMSFVAAASVILLAGSAALNIYLYKEVKEGQAEYTALAKRNATMTVQNEINQTKMLDMYNNMQLMSQPGMVKVVMPGVKDAAEIATVFWDSKTKDVYLLASSLPATPDDKQYQLWAIVDGKPVDAGVIGECNGLCRLSNIPSAQAFAITLEKKGGSPAPTMDQLHVYGKVS